MIEILYSEYGSVDVTSIVKSYVKDNKLSIFVSNNIFGDPQPNIKKYLFTKYKIDNIEGECTIEEGRELILKSRIKIVTNTYNDDLYLKSKYFYSNIEFEKISISGKNGMYGIGFFEYVMQNIDDIDWMIYIDEDCFITDTDAMLDLLYYQIDNDYDFCGMPDGGVISHRCHNPISPNAFFSIINLKKIRLLNKTMDYNGYDIDLDKFIPSNLIKKEIPYNEKYKRIIGENDSPFDVNFDNAQPYYKFFFWLLRNNFNPLYLNAIDVDLDDYTTALMNHNGKIFAYHTWMARHWSSQKERIQNVIDYCMKIKKLKIKNISKISNSKVDILFTFKRINEQRLNNLIYTIKYYKQFIPNSNIIIAEQNTTTDFSSISNLIDKHLIIHTEETLFCRGFLFNEAYNISTCKYIILADADCLPHKELLINFGLLEEKLDNTYLIAHKTMYYLTKNQTDLLLNQKDFDPNTNIELLEKSHEYIHVGGVGFISSDQYYQTNGFKNSFVGWGGEDDDFYNRRLVSGLGVDRLEYPALHLYHESSISHGYNEQELQEKRDKMPPVKLVRHENFEI